MAFPGFDTPAYGNISGGLPWGNNSGGIPSGNPAQIGASYDKAYNNALSMNQANYNNILTGYQKAVSSQTSAQQAIQAGYSDLYNQVLSKVSGIGAARETAIKDSTAQGLAGTTQQLVDRGLGNTTIQSSVNRGYQADQNSRLMENDESVAKMLGDYMSNLGGAGLRSQQAGVDNVSGIGLRQLDFMNSVTAKYPDAGMYGGLAQQAGMNQAANRAGTYGGGAFYGAGAGGPKLGYVPGGAPFYGSGGYTPPTSTASGANLTAAPAAGGYDWNSVGSAYAQPSAPQVGGNALAFTAGRIPGAGGNALAFAGGNLPNDYEYGGGGEF